MSQLATADNRRYGRKVGPNFFIWIAIAVVIASTVPALYGHVWTAWIGWPLAIALGVINKVRALRRRRTEQLREFD
jgi:hypothetical protein